MKRLIVTILILFSMCLICSCKSDIHSRVSDEDWEYIYSLGYEDGQFDEHDYAYEEGYSDGRLEASEEVWSSVYDFIDRCEKNYFEPIIEPYLKEEYVDSEILYDVIQEWHNDCEDLHWFVSVE